MSNEESTPETDLAIPDNMSLTQVPQTSVVEMLLETAGTIKLTDDQRAIIFAKVDPDLVEIREDGIVYLPAVEYKVVLCETFGLEWAIVPESPKPVEVDGVILWGFHLFVQGQPIAFAWGEQQYKKGSYMMSYGDAMEGAKSNAIMRLCKQIGIAQDLWRPSFIRKWKAENAEEYEGWDKKRQETKKMWKRLENTGNAEESETDEHVGEEEKTGDVDRFRRTAFLMVEYLQIDAGLMKAECKEKFNVESRSMLEPAQWMEYRDYLKGTMDPNQVIDYERWLDVRSAIKSLTERGMDKKELTFYLQTHYLRMDVLAQELPEDLAQRLRRSGASDKSYASLQKGVQRAKEWAESIGGQGKAEELIEHLAAAMDDVTDDSPLLAEFLQQIGIGAQEDESYRLTDISPALFEGWKAALGVQDNQPKPDPEPPGGGGDEFLDGLPVEPESAPDDTGQGNTQTESEKGQERDDTPASKDTLARLAGLVKTFPGSIYMTVKSNSFKERAAADIGRTVATIKDFTEQEAQVIIGSLENEKAALGNQDPMKYTEEQLVEAKETGEITEDFVDEGEEPKPTEDPEAQKDTRPATEKDSCSWEQQNEIYSLLAELLPKSKNKRGDSLASGTVQARQWISDAIERPSPGIANLTYDEAPEVILALQDKLSDKQYAAENAPA